MQGRPEAAASSRQGLQAPAPGMVIQHMCIEPVFIFFICGMVIQHMCIEPVFIFFICNTSDAPAAGSDQKNKIKNKK